MVILSNDQIGKRWGIIKSAIRLSALPTADTNEDKMTNMLKSLLSGRALCWMSGNERKPRTVLITTIAVEEISGTKNLLIYCAHGFEKEKSSTYMDMLEGIRRYAIEKKCDNIISYVYHDDVKGLLEKYGARCEYTLAVFPLN